MFLRSRPRIMLLCAALPAALWAADFPVTQVTLYKHGVAHFERSGEIKPGDTVRLDFKPDEMNDVLKSLTVTDRNGGKVNGVRYDSSDPLEKRLADFPFQVGQGSSLAAFLDQMKGARIELKMSSGDVGGTIVSARIIRETDRERTSEHETIVLLMDSGEIRSFDLGAASAVKLSDARLQNQLAGYLLVLNSSHSKDRRSVYLDAAGTGARQLMASYMTPAAVWKSSYRLIFGAAGEPMLEGWAIVDNTTGEDWNNVRLAVVSGKPVSFISRLYEPRYVQRQVADLAENQAAVPVVYQGAMDSVMNKVVAAPAAAARAQLGGGFGGANGRVFEREEVKQSSFGATADGRQAGELFEYSFATPVTVKQGESAMLPFLQQKIGARKLLVYSESYGLNPRDAAELTNITGKTLDGGPITVYDAGSYAGEALVETLPMGDKRLISYGVDLGTRITTAFDSSQALVREIHFKRGVLTTRSAVQETKTFTIKNVDAKAKTLVIEHGQRPGYTLLGLKPSETTANAYRFEVKLAASGWAACSLSIVPSSGDCGSRIQRSWPGMIGRAARSSTGLMMRMLGRFAGRRLMSSSPPARSGRGCSAMGSSSCPRSDGPNEVTCEPGVMATRFPASISRGVPALASSNRSCVMRMRPLRRGCSPTTPAIELTSSR